MNIKRQNKRILETVKQIRTIESEIYKLENQKQKLIERKFFKGRLFLHWREPCGIAEIVKPSPYSIQIKLVNVKYRSFFVKIEDLHLITEKEVEACITSETFRDYRLCGSMTHIAKRTRKQRVTEMKRVFLNLMGTK